MTTTSIDAQLTTVDPPATQPSPAPAATDAKGTAPVALPAADPLLMKLGTLMLGCGTLALLGGAIINRAVSGSVVAAAVFTVIMGLAIRFPTLLQDGTLSEENRPNYSTTRVITLLVVASFVMLTVKAGWSTNNLELLKIDHSWVLVLGVVLGGKVAQGIAEKK